MNFEKIFPIVTLIIGWLLGFLNNYFGRKYEKRKLIGRTISDLLEVRHQFHAYEETISQLSKRFPLRPQDEAIAQMALLSMLPADESLHTRFAATVTLISTFDPLLAFELRYKDMLKPWLTRLGSLAHQTPLDPELFSKIQGEIVSSYLPVLNQIIVRLAWRHSPVTWWRVRKYLTTTRKLPREAARFFRMVQKKLDDDKSKTQAKEPESGHSATQS